jgi:transposase
LFQVSASTAIKWMQRWRSEETLAARPIGGSRGTPLDAHESWLLALIVELPDLTLEEIHHRLVARGVAVAVSTIWRFYDRHGISFKKTVHASEQERPDVKAAREAWRESQPSFDPMHLIFLDETGAATDLARTRGRGPKGARVLGRVLSGHWKTTPLIAGLRTTGLVATFLIDCATDREVFLTYIERCLVPELRPGDIVVKDNLPAHKYAHKNNCFRFVAWVRLYNSTLDESCRRRY